MNRPVRVLHVITDTNIGGAGMYLLAYLDAYDRRRFMADVVIPTGSRLAVELDKRHVPYTEALHIADRSFSVSGVSALCRLFKQKKPAIVHTHAALSARLAARLYGRCTVVYTRHSVFPVSRRASRFPVKPLTGFVNNTLCDAVIAVSPAAADNLVQTGVNPKKIHVIYNGIPTPTIFSAHEKVQARARFGIPSDAFVVAQIARLTAVKGQDFMLDAAKQFVEADRIVVLLAGDGPDKDALQKRLTNENMHHVRLLGFVPDIEAVTNIADVQVSASFGTEATSLALLEGLALGVPAVASDFGGNPYVVRHGENGLIVPQKDANALYRAVLRLKNDTALRTKLAHGAKQSFEAHFRVQDMVSQMESLYETLLDQ